MFVRNKIYFQLENKFHFTDIVVLNISIFVFSLVLDRARQVTRMKKRKLALANIKKKAERLRKNPKPMAKKVELMLKYKGLWGAPKAVRWKK